MISFLIASRSARRQEWADGKYWGFGGKDSVRPHYLFLAAAAPFFRAGWRNEKHPPEFLRMGAIFSIILSSVGEHGTYTE